MLKFIDEFNFQPKNFYTVEEYKNVNESYKPSDKSSILGIVEGKSFVLNGVSRNGRYYPKELWENALKDPEVIQMLNDKLMFGCIGHPENYTLDDLLAEGKVSHIVTDIRIGNDGFGYATYEILDTPAGRILYTVLKAGSKLKVSTRAFGEFVNEYKEIDGRKYQVINPKNFKLESIDFVIKPGIASVDVSLVEKLEKENKKDIEKLKESKITLCEDGICTIIEEVELYENIKKQYDEKIKKYEKIIKNLKDENKSLEQKLINNIDTNDLKELLIAEIENYLKKISVLKSRDDIVKEIIEFLDDDEINEENLKKLKNKLNEIESIYTNKIIEIIDKLLEQYKEKSKEEKIYNFGKELNDFLTQKENENLINDYKDIIKDLSNKLIESENKIKKYNFIAEDFKKLKKELNNKNIIIEQLNLKIKTFKNKIQNLQEDLNTEKENKKILEKKLNNIEKEYQILKENFETKVENEKIKIIESVRKEIAENLEKEISKKYEELTNYKIENIEEKLKLKEKELNKINNLYEKEKNKLIKKINLLENENKKLQNNINIIEEKLNNKNNELKQISEKINNSINEKLENEIKNLQEELKNYQILYLKTLYKNIDESTVKNILNNYNIEKAKQILEEKEMQNLQNNYIVENSFEIVEKEKEIILAEKLL